MISRSEPHPKQPVSITGKGETMTLPVFFPSHLVRREFVTRHIGNAVSRESARQHGKGRYESQKTLVIICFDYNPREDSANRKKRNTGRSHTGSRTHRFGNASPGKTTSKLRIHRHAKLFAPKPITFSFVSLGSHIDVLSLLERQCTT